MKTNNYIKISMILGALALSACTPNNSSNQNNSVIDTSSEAAPSVPEVVNLKTAFINLNKGKNYTANVKYNGTYYYSIFVNENFVGTDGDEPEILNMYLADGVGIYSLNYNDGSMVSGEYQLNDEGENYTDLFDNNVAKTMYGVATDFVDEIKDDATTLDVDDKFYKLALLDYVGIDRAYYVDLDTVTAKYEDGLTIDLNFVRNNKYTLSFYDFGKTENNHVKTFFEQEGKAYTPDIYMSTMKRLLKGNNFVSNVYSFDAGEDGDLTSLNQVYNPHYFYSTSGALNDPKQNKSGYISFNRSTPVTNTSSPYYINGFDTQPCGIYMFAATGVQHSFAPQVAYENPDMEKFMHYPSLLKLLGKTQFFTKGVIQEFSRKYTNKKNCYILRDLTLVKDFATNFSLDQSYDFKSCIPYALGVEFTLGYNGTDEISDANTTIIFHYCFTYNHENYDYLVPLFSFGETNNTYLDGFYELYND